MRKLIILALAFTTFSSYGQESQVKDVKIKSEVLGGDVNYTIYLPVEYEKSTKTFPVLFLLHGLGADETAWIKAGSLQQISDELITNGEITPMVVVMPDGGDTWYLNNFNNTLRYEDFFIKELMPHIETMYRVNTTKEQRAIGGLSMGGEGALLLALKHPDLFSMIMPLSAAIFTDKDIVSMAEDNWKRRFTNVFDVSLTGEARLTDHWYSNSVFNLIETSPIETLKSFKYYIDCGDDDHLIKANMHLHAVLLDKEVPHEFRVRDGGHNFIYWQSALPDVLRFASKGFGLSNVK